MAGNYYRKLVIGTAVAVIAATTLYTGNFLREVVHCMELKEMQNQAMHKAEIAAKSNNLTYAKQESALAYLREMEIQNCLSRGLNPFTKQTTEILYANPMYDDVSQLKPVFHPLFLLPPYKAPEGVKMCGPRKRVDPSR